MTGQQRQRGPLKALVAGEMKVCPICSAIRDTWSSLEYHVTEHHDQELHIPDDAEEQQ